MAYAPKIVKVIWLGNLFGSLPWSMGVSVKIGDDATSPPSSAQIATFLQDLHTRSAAVTTAWASVNMNTSTITKMRGYAYTSGGTTADQVGEYIFPTAIAGTSASPQPALLSMVASLRSATVGRSGRGRMYIPVTSYNGWTASGQYDSTKIASVATNLKTAFDLWNSLDASAVWYKSVRVVVASATKAANYPVTNVIVDSLPDTQHRRENQQIAAASSNQALA